MAAEIKPPKEISEAIGRIAEQTIPPMAGAVAGALGAGFLTLIKWIIELAGPQVEIATGLFDIGLSAYILYDNIFAPGADKKDPFMKYAGIAFGVIDLLVGVSALVSGVQNIQGLEGIDEKMRKEIAKALAKALGLHG